MPRLDATTRHAVAGHAAGALALSVPWPLLLVEVARRNDDPFLLGLAGSARMVPFIVCSWAAGRLADRMRRDLLIRISLVARGALLLTTAVALVTGHVWAAVVAAGVAVAVATPAYPALVAAMPGLAKRESRRATDLLVTVEVGAFVVGAAVGGVLLHPATRMLVPWLPVALVLLAGALLLPVRLPRPAVPEDPAAKISATTALAGAPAARRAIGAMAVVNLAVSLVALALVPLALVHWDSDEAGYGIATGALGLSCLAAPLLTRLARTPSRGSMGGLVLLGLGLLLVVPAPSVAWSLAPLALVGAASVAVEASATGVLQDELPDSVRATVLGLNDAVIISAALAGSLLAPVAIAHLGGALVLTATAALVFLAAWWVRPRAGAATSRVVQPASVVLTLREDDHAQPATLVASPRAPADLAGPRGPGGPRTPADPVGLRWIGVERGTGDVIVRRPVSRVVQRVPEVRRPG
jgi:MFS family permease